MIPNVARRGHWVFLVTVTAHTGHSEVLVANVLLDQVNNMIAEGEGAARGTCGGGMRPLVLQVVL
jgi:hypothetical protein